MLSLEIKLDWFDIFYYEAVLDGESVVEWPSHVTHQRLLEFASKRLYVADGLIVVTHSTRGHKVIDIVVLGVLPAVVHRCYIDAFDVVHLHILVLQFAPAVGTVAVVLCVYLFSDLPRYRFSHTKGL